MEAVAVAKAKAGDYDGARNIAAQFDDQYIQEAVLTAITTALAESGNLADAMRTALMTDAVFMPTDAFVVIASTRPEINQVKLALEVALASTDQETLCIALAALTGAIQR